jgi:hypothetical protein
MPRQDCETVSLVLVFLIATTMRAEVGIVIIWVVVVLFMFMIVNNNSYYHHNNNHRLGVITVWVPHLSSSNVNNLGFNVLNNMHFRFNVTDSLRFQQDAAGQQSPLSDCQRLDGCGSVGGCGSPRRFQYEQECGAGQSHPVRIVINPVVLLV